MVAIKKTDMLIDLHTGAMGSFVKTTPVQGEIGLVDVWYKPLNSLKTHALKSIPQDMIQRVVLPIIAPGSQGTYTIISQNSKGESIFRDAIRGMESEKMNEIREKLIEAQFKSRTSEHKARESERSLDRQEKKRIERNPRRSGLGPYDFGGVNRPYGSGGISHSNNDFLENL